MVLPNGGTDKRDTEKTLLSWIKRSRTNCTKD